MIGSAVGCLREDLHGAVIGVEDERWDDARRPWNRAVEQRPAAVVVAADVDDVVTTLRFAAEHGMRVATQATGHGAGDPLDGMLLLRTGALRQLRLDPARRVARIGPGVLWRQLLDRTDRHGLTGLVGTGLGLGVTGYSLAGGVGLLARHYGLAAHRIRSAKLVTADGEVLTVDRQRYPELFWALRGGGGGFGVITALDIELVAVPALCAGQLIWPEDAARDMLRVFRNWVDTVPDSLTSLARVLQMPPAPELPEPLRGRRVATLTVCHLGAEVETRVLLRPFAELGTPLLDTLGPKTPTGLDVHGDPPMPVPARLGTELLAELPEQAIDAVLELGPGPDSPLMLAEIRHLGGALAQPHRDHGSAGHVSEPFLLEGLGLAPTAELGDAVSDQLARFSTALAPWRSGRTLRNFATLSDQDPRRFFAPDTLSRLVAIQRCYDPQQILHDPLTATDAVPPAGESERP